MYIIALLPNIGIIITMVHEKYAVYIEIIVLKNQYLLLLLERNVIRRFVIRMDYPRFGSGLILYPLGILHADVTRTLTSCILISGLTLGANGSWKPILIFANNNTFLFNFILNIKKNNFKKQIIFEGQTSITCFGVIETSCNWIKRC